MGNIVLGEERRRVILTTIDATKNYAIKLNADKRFIEELNDIQQRIESANVLETYFADFGIKELLEAEGILHEIRVSVQQKFRKRDINNKRRFQISAIPLGLCIFGFYYVLVQQAKLVPSDFIDGAVNVSIGILIATLFYIFDTLTIYYIGELVRSKEEWSFIKQLIIVLMVATIMFLSYYVIIQFYSINIYVFLSPYLLHLLQGAAKMDIGSLFVTTSLALGDLVALFATWDFIQTRLRKQKNDILNQERAG